MQPKERWAKSPNRPQIGMDPKLTTAAHGWNERSSARKGVWQDPDETLIVDSRAKLTPAEMVERKLCALLKGKLVPVSHLRMTRVADRGRSSSR
jgi:hypothetical protein